jgi:Flp pilus assembly protein TadG
MQKTDSEKNALRRGPRRLWRENRGAMAIITALMMIPVLFAMGMAFDLTLAQSRKDKIQGYSDAAALGGVTPSMMTKTDAASVTQSTALFEGHLATLPGVTYSVSNFTINATDADSGNLVNRTVVVTWKASSQNVFSTLLGMSTFPISGTSTAASSTAPNIDFYLLLDSSPSMLLAATPAGVCQLSEATCTNDTSSGNYVGLSCSNNTSINCSNWTANPNTTPQLAGCAFGCHESNPSADDLHDPSGEDNYALARSLSITLRSDLVMDATENLMTTAYQTEQTDHAIYRVGIYSIDANLNTIQMITPCLVTSQTCASGQPAYTTAGNYAPLEVYQNNQITNGNSNNDEDSNLDLGLSSMDQTTYIPTPGNGASGQQPQAVLFIVSDGMIDESASGSTAACGPGRICAPINTVAAQDWCSEIKARGIRIAFLYTTYQPLSNSGWNANSTTIYSGADDAFNVEYPGTGLVTAAQNCASQGLFFQVQSGGDISAALQTLFQEAVATARLTH